MVVEGKWFAPGSEAPEAFAIREAVFGRGRDPLDDEAWNVVVWHEGQPAAAGRLRWAEGAFCVEDVAVLPELRGRGLGDLTLRLLLFKAETHAARLIRLIATDDTVAFFARMGFAPEGEGGRRLQPMLLWGENLCLDTCASCSRNCPNRHA